MKTLLLIISVCILDSVQAKNPLTTTSTNSTGGTKKNIPVDSDGGIYYFNPNGFFQPGDTACIVADHEYPYIYLSGFVGTAAKPIVIINSGGQVICNGTSYSYNIIKSRYFRFTGTGVAGIFYGFKTDGKGIAAPAGMSVRDSSTDFEIDHFEATRVSVGILAKINSVSCSPGTYGTGWTVRNVSIHDNYVHNSEGEGFYLGHTFTTDQVNDCNGNPITVENIKIDGIQVYNNITDSTGWDGIQVAAARHANIYNNKVTHYGLVNMGSQQAGMILGGKSTGSVHDNYINGGTGEGLQIFGYGVDGPIKIYNNVIIDAGFDGTSTRQSALAIDDRPEPANQYTGLIVEVINNTIVNSGRNNIIINNSYNTMGTGNKVYNNLLLLPNNTSVFDADKYIKVTSGISIDSTNNYESMVIANAKFVFGKGYHLQSTSPAVNIGLNATTYGVTKDIDGVIRQQGSAYDAGAYEYNSGTPPPNQLPLANAGNNTAIALPTSSTTLMGIGIDNDGTISSYSWMKISGPSGGTISSPNTPSTTITGLVQGIYSYALSVVDNNGAIGKDTVQVTVNAAANKAPSASAGNDVVVTLPSNSTTLTGSGTDTDGTINSYSWAKVSGPSGGNISSPNSASTSITGLIEGIYSYVISVVDNNGAIGKDTVQVTVNGAISSKPVAQAGSDVNITRPVSSISLNGSGTDGSGTIISYEWKKVFGPVSYKIKNKGLAQTTASKLKAGTYKFELTVTNNNGAIGKDTMQVVVTAAYRASEPLARPDILNEKTLEIETSIVRAFPNPVKNVLTLNIKNYKPYEKSVITITSVSGKMVYKKEIEGSENILPITQRINLSAIAAGLYMVNVKSGNSNKQSSTKIIKVN